MNLPYQSKHSVALYLSALATSLFAEPGHASGGPAALGLAILFIGFWNIVFYGLVIFCCMRALRVWRSKRKIAIWSILIATFPFLHYSVEIIRANLDASRRPQQIAALVQQPIVPTNQPRSIETNGFEVSEVGALVAVGVLDEIQSFYPYQNTTRVLKLHEGPECLDFETSAGERAELRRIVLARYAFQRCVKEMTRDGSANAPIQLFSGDRAPNRYRGPACLGGGNHPLELRWTPQNGGALIAFWESPSYIAHTFPPAIWFNDHQIWRCVGLGPDNPDFHFQDRFKFISTALGFKNIDDFPKSLDVANVPKALRLLIPKMASSRYAHDSILALLGQWPSTPAIDEALHDQKLFKHGSYIIREATALLTEPDNDDRRKRLYPHLLTHLPTLLDICSPIADESTERTYSQIKILEYCSKLKGIVHDQGLTK